MLILFVNIFVPVLFSSTKFTFGIILLELNSIEKFNSKEILNVG
jgi:hypothetical protein